MKSSSVGVIGVLFCLFVVHYCPGDGFSYQTKDQWPSQFLTCGGSRQSPVDLDSGVVQYKADLKAFNFSGFNAAAGLNWTMKNNGFSAEVGYSGDTKLTVSGGSLNAIFEVVQFHFHWGNDSSHGSEHAVDGKKYPLEMHIVTYNRNYANFSEAKKYEDGLAALSFLFEVAETNNTYYSNIVEALPRVPMPENETDVNSVDLTNMMASTADYYRYSGSLTTPTCDQVVTWTVFKNTIKISEIQIGAFRTLKDSDNKILVDNYRALQPLNNRTIYSSFQLPSEMSTEAGATTTTATAHSWSYEDVNDWAKDFPSSCSGQKQSPVDLVNTAAYYDPEYVNDPLTFTNFNHTTGVSWTITNNGHTVQVNYGGSTTLQMTGGSLGCFPFQVVQFHFHWGSDNTQGSEHTLNGLKYPLEMHIVTYNTKYSSFPEAQSHADGLAVLGLFVEISETANAYMTSIVSSLSNVTEAGTHTDVVPVALKDLLPGTTDFYRYSGGLTTPTCKEVVTWTVFKDTIKMSEAQIKAFRTLMDSHESPIVNNYRPVQPLNSRSIKTSFKIPVLAPASSAAVTSFSIWPLASLLLLSAALFRQSYQQRFAFWLGGLLGGLL